jgi:hypothetical protein
MRCEVDSMGHRKFEWWALMNKVTNLSVKLRIIHFLARLLIIPFSIALIVLFQTLEKIYFGLFKFRDNPKTVHPVDIMQTCLDVVMVFRKIWITQGNRMDVTAVYFCILTEIWTRDSKVQVVRYHTPVTLLCQDDLLKRIQTVKLSLLSAILTAQELVRVVADCSGLKETESWRTVLKKNAKVFINSQLILSRLYVIQS